MRAVTVPAPVPGVVRGAPGRMRAGMECWLDSLASWSSPTAQRSAKRATATSKGESS